MWCAPCSSGFPSLSSCDCRRCWCMGDLHADQDKGLEVLGPEALGGATAGEASRSVDSAPSSPSQRSRLIMWAASGIFLAWLAYLSIGSKSLPSADREPTEPSGTLGSSTPASAASMWSRSLGRDKEAQEIRKRYVDVREYFESLVAERASGRGNWSTLMQTRDGKLRVYLRWPDAHTTVPGAVPLVGNGSLPHVPFVLAQGDYDAPPHRLWEAMRAKNVAVMQPLIDPFFEAYHTIKTFPDDPHIELGLRRTSRLLVYGKRDFALASIEEQRPSPQNPTAASAWTHTTSVLSLPEHPLMPEVGGYTRAYQDMVAFYTPLGAKKTEGRKGWGWRRQKQEAEKEGQGRSRVSMLMRTDLRGNIPLWLFSKTCGHTGLHVLQTLHKVVQEQ